MEWHCEAHRISDQALFVLFLSSRCWRERCHSKAKTGRRRWQWSWSKKPNPVDPIWTTFVTAQRWGNAEDEGREEDEDEDHMGLITGRKNKVEVKERMWEKLLRGNVNLCRFLQLSFARLRGKRWAGSEECWRRFLFRSPRLLSRLSLAPRSRRSVLFPRWFIDSVFPPQS